MPEGLIDVEVELTDVLEGFRTLEENVNYAGRRAIESAEKAIRSGIAKIVMQIYDTAVVQAGPGFYKQYADHLRTGLKELEIEVFGDVDSEVVTITIGDLEDSGGWDDFANIMHYEAIADDSENFSIRNPPRVEMGADVSETWGGTHEEDNRGAYWKAMQTGAVYTATVRGFPRQYPTEGQLDETLEARVNKWEAGGQYPEWVLLDEGLETGEEPSVTPTQFIEMMNDGIRSYAEIIVGAYTGQSSKDALNWDRSVRNDPLTPQFLFRGDFIDSGDVKINSAGRKYYAHGGYVKEF